jgi:hypothetical protein
MPGAAKTFATSPLPGETHASGPFDFGQRVRVLSLKDWVNSNCTSQVLQRYSYVGMFALDGLVQLSSVSRPLS